MELIGQTELSLIGIKTLGKKNLGIIYDSNVTKTIGDLLEILLHKVKYYYPGITNSSTELFFVDEKATQQIRLDLSQPLDEVSDSLELGIKGSKEISDYKYHYKTIKSQLFDTPESIPLHLKTLTGKTIIAHTNISKATVLDLKYKIEEVDGTAPDNQRLIANGFQLEDKALLNSYEIGPQSTIHIVLRLRGGMLHEVSGRDGYKRLEALTIYDYVNDVFVQA